MSNQYGIILSEPKYTLKKVEDIRQTPMREIYLENDHRAHYRVEERTKGKYLTDLASMTASLSLNPSGSAAPLLVSISVNDSGSFTSATSSVTYGYSSSISASALTQSFTSSFLTITSASFTSSWTASTTESTVIAPMAETDFKSAEYLGTFLGSDLTMAFSASISQSYLLSTSSSLMTASVSTSYIPSGTVTTSIDTFTTLSFANTTSSFTQSTEIPLPNTGRKVYEIITSGSHIKVSSPMIARSVRWME